MFKRLLILCVMFVIMVAAPAATLAQEVRSNIDARIQAYGPEAKVNLTDASTNSATSIILLCFLTLIGLSVIFKTSKRTHLD